MIKNIDCESVLKSISESAQRNPQIIAIGECGLDALIETPESIQTDIFEKQIIPNIKKGLSATVYTQVSDVEDEINGILTYDRRVVKVDAQRVRKINEKLRF